MTTLSKSEISQLSTILTGEGHGRLATVDKTAARFIAEGMQKLPGKTKEEVAAILLHASFDEAKAALAVMMAPPAPKAAPKPKAPAKAKPAAAPKAEKGPSKQARFIDMMRRPEGCSIDEAVAAFEWQKHTVRGAVAGAVKAKLGLTPTATKEEGRGTVYRLPAEAVTA